MAEIKKIIILHDCEGSPDGRFVKQYHEGEEFILDSRDMPTVLAKVFVNELKVAKAVKEVDGTDAPVDDMPAADAVAPKSNKKAQPSETK